MIAQIVIIVILKILTPPIDRLRDGSSANSSVITVLFFCVHYASAELMMLSRINYMPEAVQPHGD